MTDKIEAFMDIPEFKTGYPFAMTIAFRLVTQRGGAGLMRPLLSAKVLDYLLDNEIRYSTFWLTYDNGWSNYPSISFTSDEDRVMFKLKWQ